MIELTKNECIALTEMLRSCTIQYVRKNRNLSHRSLQDLMKAYEKIDRFMEANALDEIAKEFFAK